MGLQSLNIEGVWLETTVRCGQVLEMCKVLGCWQQKLRPTKRQPDLQDAGSLPLSYSVFESVLPT